MGFDAVLPGAVLSVPTVFPFGMPKFDLIAAIPLMVFSVISMAEATGQTVAIAEAAGKDIDVRTDVPKTIRGDALISLIGACLGTSLIITSGENIGVVRATGVRSRYVTATSGVILILLALFAPLGRLINAIPGPVVGGTAVIVFCIIAVMGIDQLRKVDLHDHGNLFTLAAGLTMGLLPILVHGHLQQVSVLCADDPRQRSRRRHHHRRAAQHRVSAHRRAQAAGRRPPSPSPM